MPQMLFDYHYGMEAEQYAFFRIPKALITDPFFRTLSTDAKLLYGLMLDRMSLSIKNGWMDENQRVYIYFTLDDVCEQLCCKTDKAVKLFAELDENKGIGLISRIRQGQGRPSKIYVKRFISQQDAQTSEDGRSGLRKDRNLDLGKTEIQTAEEPKTRLPKKLSQDFGKTEGNDTETNNTDKSDTNLSIHPSQMDQIERCREQIKDNLEYPVLIQQYPKEDMDEIVELMLEVLCIQDDFIKIGRKQLYTTLVKDRFQKLNQSHIAYVMECMRENPSEIHNIKAYLLESLFNAPATCGNYYNAKVNHDIFGIRQAE